MVFWKKKKESPPEKRAEKGLGIKHENGYYAVYQLQTMDKILECWKEQHAIEAKRKLDVLINWDTEEDVYYKIIRGDAEYFDTFVEMNRIIDFYGIEEEDEVEEECTQKNKKDGFYYYVKNNQTQERYEVKGEKVALGLAVHQEKNGFWTIDHIPTENMLKEFESYEQAKKCSLVLSELVNWEDERSIKLFTEIKDFVQYLKLVTQSILDNQQTPDMPEKLKYKLEFFHIQNEKSDFKRFCNAIDRLMEMSGLETIKIEVLNMIYFLAGKRKNQGIIKQGKGNFHMVFYGPPGTGKTEIARIMSDILASLGFLSKGNLVEADRSSLVGEHIGQTAPKVKKVIEEAMGGTLFIDEAYSLVGSANDFGHEAVSTLIKEMEDNKGEFVVILAGYEAEMNELLRMNEGFRSRIKNFFHFFDYTPNQVMEIVINILQNKGYVLSEDSKDAIERAIKNIAKQGKVEGNARTARNMAEDIEEELNIRIGKDKNKRIFETNLITKEDVKFATDEKAKNNKRNELEEIKKEAEKKLQNLIGLVELKKQAKRILNTLVMDNMRYQNELMTTKNRMHMAFYGPPGTGKTTVARIMGEFLKGAGLLSSGHFIEVSRSDLVAGYVGQTADKVKKVVAKALGGILFIDEAYSLASGDNFGKEALDTLIKEMEDNGDNLVVILAGYREHMDKLMDLNDGLESRVPHHFDFPHYTAEELYIMSLIQLETNYGLIPNTSAKTCLKLFIQRETEKNGGYVEGDGRWIRNLCEDIKTNQSNRLSELSLEEVTVDKLRELVAEDIA